MKKALLLVGMFCLSLLVGVAWAQQSVTGKVTSEEDGEPLPGVNVVVKGTNSGTVTNLDGEYSLSVPNQGSILVFSFIGLETREVEVGNQSVINITMAGDVTQLGEVVVVGYSTTTQKAFTGSAKVVESERIESKNVSNISQALAGEVSGVRVINTSGQPGTAATIRIRGLGSVNGNRDPLYVVDGVPFTGSISSINTADIASTTVLKDAAATAIYGSRGANGVILVTTNSGKGQKSYIDVDFTVGTNMALIPRYSTITSPEKYIELSWEGLYNQGFITGEDPVEYANTYLFDDISPDYNIWNAEDAASLIDPQTKMIRPGITRKFNPEDWEEYGFQSSSRQELNVRLGGSSDQKSNYYMAFGFLDDKGYIINSDYQRLTGRLNVKQEITKWLSGGINFNYARSESNSNGQSEDSGSIFWFVDNIPPIYPLFLRDEDGEFIVDPIFGGNQYDYGNSRGFGGLTNAIADATYNIERDYRNELNGNASLDFTLLEGLRFENLFGAQYYHNKYVLRNNKYYGSAASQNGYLYFDRSEHFNYNLLNLLRYNKSFGDHNFEVLVAHETSRWERNHLIVSGSNLVDPNLLDFSNVVVTNPTNSYTSSYSLESYFGQINYDLNQTYFLSGTVRRDGSSRFRLDKWGTFGSVGAGWLVSNEDFMNSMPIIRSLKLKASYGVMGDQAGVGYYPGFDLYDVDNLNDNPAFAFDTKGNPDLTWETSQMFQTGIEFEIGNFLAGSVDYYIKNTDNLIFDVRQAPSLGYAILTQNAGRLRNNGLEFDLTGYILKSPDYHFNIGLNGEIFNNEITEMPLDPVTNEPKAIDVQTPFGWSQGHSIFDFYMREWAGVDPQDGTAMWNVYYVDANNDNIADADERINSMTDYLANNPDVNQADIKHTTTKTYSEATQKYVDKSAIPDVRGAFNISAGYKGLSLNIQMLYSLGGYAYDYVYATLMDNAVAGSNNWHTDILNRWQNEGDETNVPRLSNDEDPNVISLSTRFLTKANYMSLNHVRLNYELPQNLIGKIGLGGLSIWVSGDNLWLSTTRRGFNPSTAEAGSSNEEDKQTRYQYSPLSSISAGLKIKI